MGKKVKKVLLTYDSFASHTSMDVSLKDELQLSTQEIGDLKIQTYGGIIREKGFQTTAYIEGLKTRKIDFILSKCQQTIPEYEYEVPLGWRRKYNLPQNPKCRCGVNKITIGKDNADLFPVVKDFHNGVCISRSNITGQFIISGKAISTSEETMMNNRTIVTKPDKMFNELTTESIYVAPVKKCAAALVVPVAIITPN